MPVIMIETLILAPPQRCFDLARDIDVHCQTTSSTRERAVAGVTSGLIGAGQTVTFEAVHFGVRQRLTSKITDFDAPHRFVDEMVEGAFASLRHVHEFEARGKHTLMRDTLEWRSPLGVLGKIADTLFLRAYMTRFIKQRGESLRRIAEDGY
jgi:ligand-binding SRPBCC domain-containing protein